MEGDLHRAWKKLSKVHGWDNEVQISADLRQYMIKSMDIPVPMAEELADIFLNQSIDKAQEVLDLFYCQWSMDNSILEMDDWIQIREIVNSWSLDLDMQIVGYVMKAVVKMGGFD